MLCLIVSLSVGASMWIVCFFCLPPTILPETGGSVSGGAMGREFMCLLHLITVAVSPYGFTALAGSTPPLLLRYPALLCAALGTGGASVSVAAPSLPASHEVMSVYAGARFGTVT